MKIIISQLIDNFYERNLPSLITRNKKTVQIAGKANVVIGMRRTGKTFFCYKCKNLFHWYSYYRYAISKL
jgi:predicted AAA+ superfamily ATPase